MTDPLFEQADALMRRHQAAAAAPPGSDEPSAHDATAASFDSHELSLELDLDAAIDSAHDAGDNRSAATPAHAAASDDDWPLLIDMVSDSLSHQEAGNDAPAADDGGIYAVEIPVLTELADTPASLAEPPARLVDLPAEETWADTEVEPPLLTDTLSAPDEEDITTAAQPAAAAPCLDPAALQQLISQEVHAALAAQLPEMISQLLARLGSELSESLASDLQQRLSQRLSRHTTHSP